MLHMSKTELDFVCSDRPPTKRDQLFSPDPV
jgi:hypothetical protein